MSKQGPWPVQEFAHHSGLFRRNSWCRNIWPFLFVLRVYTCLPISFHYNANLNSICANMRMNFVVPNKDWNLRIARVVVWLPIWSIKCSFLICPLLIAIVPSHLAGSTQGAFPGSCTNLYLVIWRTMGIFGWIKIGAELWRLVKVSVASVDLLLVQWAGVSCWIFAIYA